MVVEHLVKRTVWIAECKCDAEGFRDVRNDSAPRERTCPKCGTWLSFHEESATSPEYKKLLLE